jgi:hypothetical protein
MSTDPNLGPFITGRFGDTVYGAVSVDDRVRMVRGFTTEQCLQALRMPNLQTSVREAVERRMRKLSKGQPA